MNESMNDWHPDRIRSLRKDVLRMLCSGHNQQQPLMTDTQLTHALHGVMVDCHLDDVVTILQDMKDRNWVTFRTVRNIFPRRVQLLDIQLLPQGRDIVEQTVEHPAVLY